MRLLTGFALVLVGIAFVQSQLVIPQINNLDAVISLLPQLQGFIGQLDNILPQLAGILSSSELQSIKDKVLQLILTQAGDINGLKDKLQGLFQQFLGSKPLGRIDIDQLIQQIVGATSGALPGVVLGLLGGGKREVTDARIDINALLALAEKFQLSSFIPQIEQFLGADKLQQLQTQVLATLVTALGNNWNPATIAQALQQLVTQFIPQANQMRIDWKSLGQSLLNGIVGVAPALLVGLLGKREATDARIDINALLALADKFQLSSFIPQIEQFLGADKLQQLQTQVLATMVTALGNNWNPATIAQALQQLITQFIPQANQMRIDWEQLGEQALNGIVSILPSLLVGLLGKRDLAINYQQLLAQLPVKNLAQLLQIINNVDKSKITSVLAKLRELLQSFFPAYRGRINFDDFAAAVLNQLNSILPTLSQSIFSNILG